MLFNSIPFIFLFVPISFAGFFIIARQNHNVAALFLAISSIVFYGIWDKLYVLLLLAHISVNFAFGLLILQYRSTPLNRPTLALAISINLAFLGYFKYMNFFIDSIDSSLHLYIPLRDITLPLGISFFTFTQIAYLVDVSRGLVTETRFIHYLLFVTYFPHLIAGPVIHHAQMMPQFRNKKTYVPNYNNIAIGLTIFTIGLAKKILIADSLAPIADTIFNATHRGTNIHMFDAWAGAISYSLQIYFDFSGYSDMAVGLSRLFNITLPENFRSPYKSTNIIEFWRRWHMTLSAFLKDYLYIPLGGNRQGTLRRYINLIATMLLGGLWHGANWTFVAWGGLHGIYLAINHAWHRIGIPLPPIVGWGLTTSLTIMAWVFFRAESFHDALSLIVGMMGGHGISFGASLRAIPWIGNLVASNPSLLFLDGFIPATTTFSGLSMSHIAAVIIISASISWTLPNIYEIISETSFLRWKTNTIWATGILMAIVISVLFMNRTSSFLYFQF